MLIPTPEAVPGAAETLTGLVAAVLSDLDGAPPADLTRLTHVAPASPRFAGPTGLGTSSLRIPRPTGTTAASPAAAGAPVAGTTAASTTAANTTAIGTAPGGAAESRLFCPGPVRDDPVLGREVNDRLVDWAEEVGIYPGRLDRLRACDFGRLIMLAHPATDDPDRLLAAAKCVLAEWATDDYFVDEVSLGADPTVVGSRLAKLHAVVDPARLPARYAPDLKRYRHEEPLAAAFRSAMRHLSRYTSAAQLGRFQHQMSILFIAWNQEADWHTNRRTPPVWEYLIQRHLNSYLPPMILIDVVAGYELSPDEFFDPRFRRAFTTAGMANVLLNDLYSGAQESETDFNLPRVIMAEDGCGPREAINRTVDIHNELMHAFVAEAGALTHIGSPALRRFLADTWAWLGGSREWHATTARYHARPEGSNQA